MKLSPIQAANRIPLASEPQDEFKPFDYAKALRIIWNARWIFAVCMMFCGVLGLLYVGQITPTYKATAQVIFDLQKQNIVDIEDVLVSSDFKADRLQNEIAVLRSTSLMERVIDTLNLLENPEFNTRLRPATPGLRCT